MPVSERIPEPVKRSAAVNDGTRQLLQWGSAMVGAGLLAAILLQTVLGGFSPTGASTNTGWFALIVALMCIPFGGLLLTLGIAKWLRNRAIQKSGQSSSHSSGARRN
jgi:nitrate reductase gamma subunit